MTTPPYIRLTAPVDDYGCYHPTGSIGRRIDHKGITLYAIAPTGARHTARVLDYEPTTQADYDRAMSQPLPDVPDEIQAAIANNAYHDTTLHDNRTQQIETPLGDATVTAWDKTTVSLTVNDPVKIHRVEYSVTVTANLRTSTEEWHIYPRLNRTGEYENRRGTDAANAYVREALCGLLETWIERNYMECVNAHYEGQVNGVVGGLAQLAEYERVIAARRQKLLHMLDKTKNRRRLTDAEQRFLNGISSWSVNLRG